jgi:hypothetical protein
VRIERMTENSESDELRDENIRVLRRFQEEYGMSEACDIEILAPFDDKETAHKARNYVESKYDVPRDIVFRVLIRVYETETKIDLGFGLHEIPDADRITDFELMLVDAARAFGGGVPGWEILTKPSRAK